MDWQAVELIPHSVELPAACAPLWSSLIEAKGVYTPTCIREWKVRLDSNPGLMPATLFVDLPENERQHLGQTYGFPHVAAPHLPPEPELSQVLAGAMTSPIPGLLVQSRIGALIAEQSRGVGLVVLLVFDGLSYEDTLNWRFQKPNSSQFWYSRNRPCLVDGRTITESAMPRIVSNPPIGQRLFRKGYKERVGFTYWERTNELTDQLFVGFAPNQIHRVSEFAEVLDQLNNSTFSAPTYIQIVRNGFDQYCHGHRERPQLGFLLQELVTAINDLLDVLASSGQSVHLYVTADHGILWHDSQAVCQLASGNLPSRHVAGEKTDTPAPTVIIKERQQTYTALVGPDHLTRKRHMNEWGFHGGVSASESLVPLIELILYPRKT